VREAEGFGNVAMHHGPTDQPGRVRPAAPDRGGVPDRTGPRKGEQAMTTHQLPSTGGVAREPRAEGGLDRRKIRAMAGDGDDRDSELGVHPIEVDNIEAADPHAIQQDRLQALEPAGRTDQSHDLSGRIIAVDLDATHADRFDPVGRGDGDGRQGRPGRVPSEHAIVHPNHPDVELFEPRP
jgi:hypothetical protein